MKRIQIYIDDTTHRKLVHIAQIQGISMAKLMKEYIDAGLEQERGKNGAQALLELAQLAEKEHWTGPSDLSERHDKYFTEAWEEQRKAKNSQQ